MKILIKKILPICDEVQCGIGRSGKLLHLNIQNFDIVPIAKGLVISIEQF